MATGLELRRVGYDHPDAVALTDRVQQYYIALYGGPDTDPLTTDMVAPPSGGFVVGYLDDAPVAMGGWFRDRDDPPGTAKLRRMYVDPGTRRAGIGWRLLAALEDDAARSGVNRMLLATGCAQTDAIAMYRRAGYTDVAPFGHYVDSGDVVCLGKSLAPIAAQPGKG